MLVYVYGKEFGDEVYIFSINRDLPWGCSPIFPCYKKWDHFYGMDKKGLVTH